ncbi:MAG TPA: glutamate--tRNA ligase [Gammaproteobacteria bacterium]|nr:glutamate--tRNA ligase [Gammaproteobacteria bacterium]
MTASPVKTRFAPSPTGELHLGNVRTALFNALLARRHGGVFLLRIEDTDAGRSREPYVEALQSELQWLGLQWQEGPGADAGHGPYRQSGRGPLYARHFQALEAAGLSYPCFCSPETLAAARAAQRRAGRPPRYPGTCAGLSQAEVRARIEAGERPTLRFRVPGGRQIRFEDLVRGPQHVGSDTIGDFIIRRADGTPAFFFSNALDDALMGVTHVLRGEDHLTNTPRQLLLLEALGLPAPRYGHIAMIVAADGSPLSKRGGSRSVRELRERGFLPGALINHLARLGHAYAHEGYQSLDELAQGFDPGHLGRSPARHDETQLLHWQREALARAGDADLWEWMASAGAGAYLPAGKSLDFVRTVRDNVRLPEEARAWAANLFAETGRLDPRARAVIAEAGAEFYRAALRALETQGRDDFRAYTRSLQKATGTKGRGLFMPLRAALTGEVDPAADAGETGLWQHGPELAWVWQLLGPEPVRRRLELALQECESN